MHGTLLAFNGTHAEALTHEEDSIYADVVGVHLAFGLLSLLGASSVYAVYSGMPRGKLDPASRIIHMITVWDLLYSMKFMVCDMHGACCSCCAAGSPSLALTGHGSGVCGWCDGAAVFLPPHQ